MLRAARQLAPFLPAIVVMALIFALSAMPSADVDHGPLYLVFRKLGHVTEYAVLAGAWWFALRRHLSARNALAVAWLISIAYAAGDEFHQSFVDNRDGRPRDVLIDTAGATLAALVIWRLTRRSEP